MDHTAGMDILHEYKKLLALNSSLETRLDEYSAIIKSRDHEIEMLQRMLTESSAYRSNLDSQVDELNQLNYNISELQKKLQGDSYIGASKHLHTGDTVSTEQQFENLKLQYGYLQTQLTDVQQQLVATDAQQ